MEKFEIFDGVPADAQHVLRVRPSANSGEELQGIVTQCVLRDLDGCWNEEERCWYLWERAYIPSNWPTHTDAIRLAGGIIAWVRPEPVNVNPSGRAPTGWHF